MPGKYIVYGDKVGCTNSQSFQVTLNGTGAPNPVQLIVIGNNGEACGTGGTVELVASTPSSGTVIWFCDGQLTNKTGTNIDAGKGYWEAVVLDGSCKSVPSQGVTVTENLNGGSIPAPVMKINGLTSGWKFCRGGSLFMEVETIETGVTYTWYADNTQIGVDSGIYYPVPSATQVVIRLRATGAGCAQEALSVETISVDQAPSAPFIFCNTPGNALCGGEATLSATGGDSYIWFKDGKEISGQTASSLKVTQTGSYTAVAVSSGGCQSIQSGATVISVSDFATLSWASHPATAIEGETKTYSVSLDFPQSAIYTWTVTGGTITNGQGTSSITVNFPAVTSATVTCTATNACGTANGSSVTQAVTVNTGCNDARITANSSLIPNIKAGQTTTLSVTATGTNPTYQWYSGTVGAGAAIGGATGAGYEYTASATGSYDFYCIVSVTGGCAEATSAQFTVTVSADPSTIAAGTGTFTGKICFDIAYSNDNKNSCSPLSSRTGQKTDFTNTTAQDPAAGSTAPYTGVQVYTFTPSGTVSNVRFDYVDASGKVIESISGGNSGNSITTAVKATVTYKASLNNDLKGLTRANALKADIYAIYNDGASNNGTDKTIKLTATLQDCACCGAATTSGGWLTFMCHNLGADESLDPFTYVIGNTDGSGGTLGYLYQWGRPADGHQLRNSATTTTLATSNTPGHAYFITIAGTSYYQYDWRSGGGNASRWGDGTQNENMAKAANDPCPAGWKVPSQKQWASIFSETVTYNTTSKSSTATANTWTYTTAGYKVGGALFLPFAGNRVYTTATVGSVGSLGYYWSSTPYSSTSNSHHVYLNSAVVGAMHSSPRSYGYSVRCVAE